MSDPDPEAVAGLTRVMREINRRLTEHPETMGLRVETRGKRKVSTSSVYCDYCGTRLVVCEGEATVRTLALAYNNAKARPCCVRRLST